MSKKMNESAVAAAVAIVVVERERGETERGETEERERGE